MVGNKMVISDDLGDYLLNVTITSRKISILFFQKRLGNIQR